MPNNVREHLIYIHGVSPDNQEKHTPAYDALHNGISAVKHDFADRDAWNAAQRCDIEWGWNFSADPSPQGDRLLAVAQEKLSKMVFPRIKEASDWTVNPLRMALFSLRELTLMGFSDMFYYISEQGKASIRETIASQILQCVQGALAQDQAISLTFLGHSAGSVVAFDFLFYLFAPPELLAAHDFIDSEAISDDNITQAGFRQLRRMADDQKLRVRRLITFGSPITMLAFRSNDVLEILAKGEALNPRHYGLARNPPIFEVPLAGPRWLNLWDKDDMIAWPVSDLMGSSHLVEDVYLDVSDWLSKAHNEYWTSPKVHQKIATCW